ncbi:MAG: hypothetical protein RL490_2157 [Pseudomonadota bacterium]|jgi:hypothetical protein
MKAISTIARVISGGLGTAAGFLGLNRAWLTLLAVAIIGAGFYVAWARTNAELMRRTAWIDVACASAGSSWASPAPPTLPGKKPPPPLRPGVQCQAEIAALAKFRADTARLTASTLATATANRDEKLLADTAATRRAAEDARTAAQAMETANDDLKNDRVSGAWFDAFNRAAGMQPARP